MKNRALVFFLFFMLFSCDDKNSYQRRIEDERNERLRYIEEHHISDDAKKDEGIYYIELQEGVGDAPKSGDWFILFYTGFFLNGNIFDSNELNGRYEPLIVELLFDINADVARGYIIRNGNRSEAIISGWAHALKYMKKGSRSRVIIPSIMAYGTIGRSGIPPYSTLIFELEVTEIRHQ